MEAEVELEEGVAGASRAEAGIGAPMDEPRTGLDPPFAGDLDWTGEDAWEKIA